MQDNFDVPAAANDFPVDPVINHHFLAWLVLIAIVVIATATLTLIYKWAEWQVRKGLGEGIDARAALIGKALACAAEARQEQQVALAKEARGVIGEQFGRTLALSGDLNKVVDKLNKALEGTREEEAVPGPGLPHGAVISGGTVINIAVANGAVSPAPAAQVSPLVSPVAVAPVTPAEGDERMSADEQSEALWRAIQKLFSFWRNLSVVSAAFRAAQQQLLYSPAWEAPEESHHDTPPAGFWSRFKSGSAKPVPHPGGHRR
ncbi:hypothetical protein [Asticcacaulis sp. EMRT-3]|uniref:hypothetical protein n=1 Tax=Asticcacaulis sp. EMRT-3 TaxID=3040349 RepID=UPI0024AF0162|nr:hypothetical protein [Asticcacaulis sp. EMRT-3]MDI7774026.1 hypothetical protein [Asticcacaulis sp. EMRT-3]